MEIIQLDDKMFSDMILSDYKLKKDTLYIKQKDSNIYMFIGDGEMTINDVVKSPLSSFKIDNNPFSESISIDKNIPSELSLVTTSKLNELKNEINENLNKTIEILDKKFQLQISNIKDTIIKEIKNEIIEIVTEYIKQLLQKNILNNNFDNDLNILKNMILQHIEQYATTNNKGHVIISNTLTSAEDNNVISALGIRKLVKDMSDSNLDVFNNIYLELEKMKNKFEEFFNNLYTNNYELTNKYSGLLEEIKKYEKILKEVITNINSPSGAVSGIFGRVEKDVLYLPSLKINSKGICVGSSHIKIKIKDIEILE